MITSLCDDLTGDFRLALRSLRKSRGFAAVALITLTVCIGVSTAAFSVIHGVMFQPLPFQDPDRLVRITRTIPERGTTAAALPLALIGDIREQSQTLAAVAGVSTGRANLIDDGPPDLMECIEWASDRRRAGNNHHRRRRNARRGFRARSIGGFRIRASHSRAFRQMDNCR